MIDDKPLTWQTVSFRVRRADGEPVRFRPGLSPADVERVMAVLCDPSIDGATLLVDDLLVTD